ncbi:MAG TPA: hypothetical protein PLM63_02780 [bacterium]|jgi:mRNA-degrading endonuclease RelE of RelBE toxin-antitoxin system|nr:hypothetical protein [bacterium]
MNQITKELKKLSKKEKEIVKKILIDIKNGDISKYDLKKLKGHDNIYRIRKNKIRIIFIKDLNNCSILTIERRSDKTYNKYK